MRPIGTDAVMPVALVQLAPSLLLVQTWPSVVSFWSGTNWPRVSAKLCAPVWAIDQMTGPLARPVAMSTFENDAPEVIERYRPLSVATSTTLGVVASTTICGIMVESPRNTGSDQVSPALLDTTR